MADLRTGKRYEMVFGPAINLAASEGGAIDLAFEQVAIHDPDAVAISVATDGLKVIGSELAGAIEAGREACTIHCRVFDRSDNREMSSALELSRARPQVAGPAPEIGVFDPRSANGASSKSKSWGPRRRR